MIDLKKTIKITSKPKLEQLSQRSEANVPAIQAQTYLTTHSFTQTLLQNHILSHNIKIILIKWTANKIYTDLKIFVFECITDLS